MGNQYRWYTTLDAVKLALPIEGTRSDALLAGYIEGASSEIERLTHRRFIPLTAAKAYPWPQRGAGRAYVLYLEPEEAERGGGDLLAVSSLTRAGDDVTAISSSDYFLEPYNSGPPYNRIEIDLASTAYFGSKDTPQRAIRVTGRWGFSEDSRAAGTVASGLSSSASATTGVCSDASLIGVGDTLLIESEALFVSAKAPSDTTANTAGALTASKAETTVPVNTGSLVKAGEVILIDSERMLVESISGNNLTVVRAFDGSTLATHANPSDVYAYRSLTLVRGVNGTTAATHADSTAISRYVPPLDIGNLCLAMAVAQHVNTRGGWTGQIGGSDQAVESRGFNLREMRDRVARTYKRHVLGAV